MILTHKPLKSLYFKIFFVLLISQPSFGQDCLSTNNNGKTFNLPCGASCTRFTLPVPDVRLATDYVFSEIPYRPYNYVVNNGTEDKSLYNDDKYSNAFNLPFDFCFYGRTYNKVVVGSNGVLSFDVSNAGCDNAFSINPPLPYGGNTQCDFEALYYPRAAIFGGFNDIDASLAASPADRKIQWRVEGRAPCRRFIVSYYKVGSFRAACSKTTPSTFQIVLHESTGIIDIFFEQKSCNSLTNSNKSILGLQNWERDKAVAAPGKNAEVWSASKKGYRFTPSGEESMLVSTEIIDANKKVLATGDVSAGNPGLLNAKFSNVCPGSTATFSLLKTVYRSCATSQQITILDTIYYNREGQMKVTASDVVNTVCNNKSGSATINISEGAGTGPYTYAVDGGRPQNSNVVKNLDFGQHTITAYDATGCAGNVKVDIKKDPTLEGTFTPYDALCPGVNDGKIIITPTSGTAPFTYGFDGVNKSVDSTLPLLLPDSYIPSFEDANGCIGADTIAVLPRTTIAAKDSSIGTSCINFNDGQVFLTGQRGTTPYTYHLGNTKNTTGIFQNLKGDTAYKFSIRDKRGCLDEKTITLKKGPGIPLNPIVTATTCKGVDNGKIELNPGEGEFTFTLSPGNIRQTTGLFENLAPGKYAVSAVPEESRCAGFDSLEVVQGTYDQFETSFTDLIPTSCKAATDGSATIVVTNGLAPYAYSLDGETYTNDAVLSGIPSGAILVNVRDANGCRDTVSVNIPTGAGLKMESIVKDATCSIASDGIISLDLQNGKAPFTYTLDAGPNQTDSNINPRTQRNDPNFKNLGVGDYTFSVVDVNGCTADHKTKVGFGSGIKASFVLNDTAKCVSSPDGRLTIHAANGNDPYYFSMDNWETRSADSVFDKLVAGDYTISIRDSAGCTADISAKLEDNNVPLKVNIAATDAHCLGSPSGSFTLKPTSGNGGYMYTLNNNEPVSENVFRRLLPGRYKIRVEDQYGCYNVFDTAIAFSESVKARISSVGTVCPEVYNGRLTINANGGDEPYFYFVNGDSLSSNVAKDLSPGDYRILVRDVNGCLFRDTVNVASGNPLATAARSTPACVLPANGTITIDPQNGTAPYSYTLGALDLTQEKNLFTNLAGGTYTVVTADRFGCKDTVTHSVDTRPPTLADAGEDVFTGVNEPVQLKASGGIKFLWDPAQYLQNSTTYIPTAIVSSDTKFTVRVTNEFDCIGFDDVMVRVVAGPEIHVPTAFSPNGDGLNDVFRPISAGMVKEVFFRVFNRFGELVYQSSDFTKGWDGIYRGKIQPIGTYVWNVRGVDRNGRVHEKKGYVVLVR